MRGSTALLLTLALAACARPRAASPEAPESPEGRTRVRALRPEAGDPGAVAVDRGEVTPVYASDENALPAFPPHALRAGCSGGVFRVRVFIGADGNVTGSEALAAGPASDRCAVALEGAVHAAVSGWRYSPAFRMRPVAQPPRPDGAESLPLWEQVPIPVFLDYEFAFEVVAGRASVRARASQ